MKLKTILALAATTIGVGAALAVTTTGYEDFGDTAGVVLWRATTAVNFSGAAVVAIAEDGTPGEAGTMTWGQFSKGQSAFAEPGKVLVYDKASSDDETPVDYAQCPTLDFRPISFGGMWVKTLAANGSPFSIVGTNDRRCEFGYANYTTLFKFDKSYTLDLQGAFTFNGTVNLDVAQDAVFSINATYPHQTITVTSGSTLKPTGAGSITIGNTDNGLIVNGTLDLSAETVPTLTGKVKISDGATLVLPAGTAIGETVSIPVCTGTLTAVGGVYVKVGAEDAALCSLTVDGGTVTKIEYIATEQTFDKDWPTVVPKGCTYTYVGGATAEEAAAVGRVEVYGTLKTSGYLGLSLFNDGTFEVVDGTATVAGNGSQPFGGTITIDAGATFVNNSTDALAYDYTATVNVYGTLSMGETRWSLGNKNTINLYEGCTVTGSGQASNGTFDWIESRTATVNVYGSVNLEAPIRLRDGARANINVEAEDNAGLTLAGTIGSGAIVKKGAGLINFTTNPPYDITVEDGAFTFAVDATPTITYSAKPGAGTTMSVWYATQDTWKGTIVLGVLSAPASLPLNTYGNANSKIVLKGTTGNCYLSAGTINPELVIDTDEDNVVEFNNGSSGQVVDFTKISGGGTLKLTGWTGCSSATYNLNTFDNFTGTLAIHNAITRNGGGTFTIRIGNIVTTGSTTPGSKVLNLTQTAVDGATGTVVYNTSSAQINGEAAKLAVTANGVYVAGGYATIGGVTTYYRASSPAYMAVLNGGSAGDSFTVLDDGDYSGIAGFTYNSETKTYTMLQMVAQFTYGVQTPKFATIAAACTAAEECDPVPTVVLLVALGEQNVPSGWEYNTPEASSTTYGTLTKGAAPSYPSYITPENETKYTAWAAYAEVSAAEAEELEEAYLLNCLPAEVEAAKAAFVFTAIYQAEGVWVVETTTSYNGRTYNGTVTVTRYSDVGCTTASETGTFFRASLH